MGYLESRDLVHRFVVATTFTDYEASCLCTCVFAHIFCSYLFNKKTVYVDLLTVYFSVLQNYMF